MALLPCRIKNIDHLEKWFDILDCIKVKVELEKTEVITELVRSDLTDNRTGIVNSIAKYPCYIMGGSHVYSK